VPCSRWRRTVTWTPTRQRRALGPGRRTCWLAPAPPAPHGAPGSGCAAGARARATDPRGCGGCGRRSAAQLTMAELLRSLQDSQLVARFQRRCGLYPAPDAGPRAYGAGPPEGAVRTPEVGHFLAANCKDGGGPANGLRTAWTPQVTAGRCSPGSGEETGRDGTGDSRVGNPASQGGVLLSGSPAPAAVCGPGGDRGFQIQDATDTLTHSL
jgi:hypothetical protein